MDAIKAIEYRIEQLSQGIAVLESVNRYSVTYWDYCSRLDELQTLLDAISYNPPLELFEERSD